MARLRGFLILLWVGLTKIVVAFVLILLVFYGIGRTLRWLQFPEMLGLPHFYILVGGLTACLAGPAIVNEAPKLLERRR